MRRGRRARLYRRCAGYRRALALGSRRLAAEASRPAEYLPYPLAGRHGEQRGDLERAPRKNRPAAAAAAGTGGHAELAALRPRHRARLRIHHTEARGAASRCARVEALGWESLMPTEQEWLQKYREALSRLAAEEAKWSKTQNVVKLLIGRLCLAAQGRHEQLDREVTRVAEV